MRAMPPIGSQGDVPVKASAFTSAGPGGVGFATGVLAAGLPETWASAWASSTTTAPGPDAAAVVTPGEPLGSERPFRRFRLTPWATDVAPLAELVGWPAARVRVDSWGVPLSGVIVWP